MRSGLGRKLKHFSLRRANITAPSRLCPLVPLLHRTRRGAIVPRRLDALIFWQEIEGFEFRSANFAKLEI
jgi:hypothetical protein